MKPISRKKPAFTIVELLTVMSIIVILISLLVPALSRVKRYAREVRQKAQFHSIDAAMEMFNSDFDGYPDSGAQDGTGHEYCGAMKLCEALLGQDLLGFHPDSHFSYDGTIDGTPATQLYPKETDVSIDVFRDNLKMRKGPYLQLENVNAYKMKALYRNTGNFNWSIIGDRFVLCDVYNRVTNIETGKKVGMPILYYKANTSNTRHDPNNLPTLSNDNDQIYNYLDNYELLRLGLPWEWPVITPQPLFDKLEEFYKHTLNKSITTTSRPYRADSYILISAGFDGLYGTEDDIFNFGD